MSREDRRPATTKKLNVALAQVSPNIAKEFESMAKRICLRVETVHTSSKNAKVFKDPMRDFENWADGYCFGTGLPAVIVSGIVSFSKTNFVGEPDVEKRLMLFIIHDFNIFLKELADVIAVAEVQVS